MLSYFYELLMSFITFILGFFGIQIGKKTVRFADNIEEKKETSDKIDPVTDTPSQQ